MNKDQQSIERLDAMQREINYHFDESAKLSHALEDLIAASEEAYRWLETDGPKDIAELLRKAIEAAKKKKSEPAL